MATCACPCGEEFEPKWSDQVYFNGQHRQRDKNRRWSVKRQKTLPVASRNSLGERREPETGGVTPLLGTQVAQTKQQRRKEVMKRQQSSEFLSPLQLARVLGISSWTLLLWRKKGFGPPFLRVTRRMIRYPERGFKAWTASLPRS